MTQMNLFTKQKQPHRQKTNLWSPKGKGGGNKEFGISRYKLLYIKEIFKKDLEFITQGTIFIIL